MVTKEWPYGVAAVTGGFLIEHLSVRTPAPDVKLNLLKEMLTSMTA